MQPNATMEISETLENFGPQSFTADDDPSLRIDYEDNENCLTQTYPCRYCGEDVTRESDTDPWLDCFDEAACRQRNGNEHDVADDERIHASRWLHSARIVVTGPEVRTSINMGSHGSFDFNVRMLPDGTLMMYVPHPDDRPSTVTLTEVRPGAYRIN